MNNIGAPVAEKGPNDLEATIEKQRCKIEELESVIKLEVMYNKYFKQTVKSAEIQLELLAKLNKDLIEENARLKLLVQK